MTILRRRLSEENGNRPTPEECYNYCGYELGYSTPFYFNIQPLAKGTNCYCCETCFRVLDPTFTIYEAVVDVTAAPTSVRQEGRVRERGRLLKQRRLTFPLSFFFPLSLAASHCVSDLRAHSVTHRSTDGVANAGEKYKGPMHKGNLLP